MNRQLSEVFLQPGRVQRRRYDRVLEHVLRAQSMAAANNITPVHFWRYKKEESPVNSTKRVSNRLTRKYNEPVAALFYIEQTTPAKLRALYGVEEKVDHTITIDLAEAIRLGELFGTEDRGRSKLDFAFYLPRPDDLYQWNKSIYEISDVRPHKYYTPLSRHIVWYGMANLLRGDSTDPRNPIQILEEEPEVEHPPWQL